jgi:hypothetical protein
LFLNIGVKRPIFRDSDMLPCLKMHLTNATSSFSRQQAINYRGITVLPVIGKIVETVIKCRTNNCVLETQNKRQRGFTVGSSPMNSALPIEESYRESKDNNAILHLVLLDAKAAFDSHT